MLYVRCVRVRLQTRASWETTSEHELELMLTRVSVGVAGMRESRMVNEAEHEQGNTLMCSNLLRFGLGFNMSIYLLRRRFTWLATLRQLTHVSYHGRHIQVRRWIFHLSKSRRMEKEAWQAHTREQSIMTRVRSFASECSKTSTVGA